MRRFFLVAGLCGLVGCGDSTTATDAGGNTGNDSGSAMTGDDGGSTMTGSDAGGSPPPTLYAMAMGTAADFSCSGSATIPAGGAATTASIRAEEFLTRDGAGMRVALPSVRIQLFSDNIIADTCAAPNCTEVTSGANGTVSGSLDAGQWFAYRMVENSGAMSVEVLANNREWAGTASEVVSATGFYASTVSMVRGLLGRPDVAASSGSTVGTLIDCMGRPVGGAEIRMFQNGSQIQSGTTSDSTLVTGLTMSNTPTSNRRTAVPGTFVGTNLPAGDIRVEAWGVLTAGSEPVRIACEEARMVTNGVSIVGLGPVRNDYAATSGCND